MRNLLLSAAAVATLSFAAAPASAANVVTLTDFYGKWSGADMTSGAPSYSGNHGALGSHNATVSWGTPADRGGSKSSYNFKSAGAINIDVPDELDDTFKLGTFTHNNFPITGGSLEAITLTLSTTLWIDGISQGPLSLVYNFTHIETPNEAKPCMFGGKNGQGINKNGCADQVTMNFVQTSNPFQIGSNFYTLDLAGFVEESAWGSDPVENFLTKEKKSNKAYLIGKLSFDHAAVPEPATWAMMLGGFFAVGGALRRRPAARTLPA